MLKQTVLNAAHRAAGARMVDFGGWDMPLNYGSQLEEHHAVRQRAGMFDVSHMCAVDVDGDRARDFLKRLLANDVDKLKVPGKALYSCMLNDAGGVIDDLIVYFIAETWFRVVVNAATRDKDIAWMTRVAAEFDVALRVRDDLAIIAVQGPEARALAAPIVARARADDALALGRFTAAHFDDAFVARTGYTGEDGFEVIVPQARAEALWRELADVGIAPAGLGARDTLRLEAGLNLYGQDMDETTTPFEAGLAWTVALEPTTRGFIGRDALAAQRDGGVPRQMIGLVLEDKGVLRHGQAVTTPAGAGEILSGTFAPTLARSIAFARVPAGSFDAVGVDLRGRAARARRVAFPFVRGGKPTF